MPNATHADQEPLRDKHGEAAANARTTRGDWPARSAVLFWIGISGVVWIALAASALWRY